MSGELWHCSLSRLYLQRLCCQLKRWSSYHHWLRYGMEQTRAWIVCMFCREFHYAVSITGEGRSNMQIFKSGPADLPSQARPSESDILSHMGANVLWLLLMLLIHDMCGALYLGVLVLLLTDGASIYMYVAVDRWSQYLLYVPIIEISRYHIR